MLHITALMDNEPGENKALIAEHGLSLLVEKDDISFLFDCGQGAHFLDNAHRLGRDIASVDAVVLSHSHYDHAAGYRDYIEQLDGCRVLYTGSDFFEKKYAFDGLRYTDLSCGFERDFLKEHGIKHTEVSDCAQLFPGVFLVTRFPRTHSFEAIPQRFVRKNTDGFVNDDFADEACIVIDLGEKLCVLVGCSHPGILNMVSSIHERFAKPVYAVFGGTHLMEADAARIEKTVEELSRMGLEIAGFSHCSGTQAEQTLRENGTMKACHLCVGGCIFID